MTALQIPEITGPAGRIDFVQERSLFAEEEDQWVLHAPGVEFIGGPGGWERVVTDDGAVQAREPLWLLRVIEAVSDARYEESGSVLGARCDRYTVIASFKLATGGAARPIEPPARTRGKLDLERMPIDVWLDEEGESGGRSSTATRS